MKLLADRLEYLHQQMPELEGERGQTGIVKASGASKSMVNQWLTGKIKSIDIKHALNIERELGVSHIWLMTGQGDPWDAPLHRVQGVMPVRATTAGTIPIKRMNVLLQAGIMRLEPEFDTTFGADVQIPAEVISQHGLQAENLIAMKVRGLSMEPLMFEDDLVVVDVSDKRPINRELYALIFDNEAVVKQLLFRGGQWYLHSVNPDFGPVNVKSGELKIIGRVVYQPGRLVTGRL